MLFGRGREDEDVHAERNGDTPGIRDKVGQEQFAPEFARRDGSVYAVEGEENSVEVERDVFRPAEPNERGEVDPSGKDETLRGRCMGCRRECFIQ